jgi:hypothetical protein
MTVGHLESPDSNCHIRSRFDNWQSGDRHRSPSCRSTISDALARFEAASAAEFGDGETDSRRNRHGGLTVIEDGR